MKVHVHTCVIGSGISCRNERCKYWYEIWASHLLCAAWGGTTHSLRTFPQAAIVPGNGSYPFKVMVEKSLT